MTALKVRCLQPEELCAVCGVQPNYVLVISDHGRRDIVRTPGYWRVQTGRGAYSKASGVQRPAQKQIRPRAADLERLRKNCPRKRIGLTGADDTSSPGLQTCKS